MAHFGIRYANDLTDEFSEHIVDSLGLLSAQLASHGVGFFFDAVDVGLPEGPLSRGARQRWDWAIRGGTGINPGIRRGCLSCWSGGVVHVMLLPCNCQQFNQATFQAHSGRFYSISCKFSDGNKKERSPAL